MATYGGLFWDVLLLSEYNEHWEDFYLTMNSVLPCDICVRNNMKWLKKNKIPKFNSTKEKNEWLWENRLERGGQQWKTVVEENNYTLESWLGQFKDKSFSKAHLKDS